MCRDGNQLAGIPKNASFFTKIVFKNLIAIFVDFWG